MLAKSCPRLHASRKGKAGRCRAKKGSSWARSLEGLNLATTTCLPLLAPWALTRNSRTNHKRFQGWLQALSSSGTPRIQLVFRRPCGTWQGLRACCSNSHMYKPSSEKRTTGSGSSLALLLGHHEDSPSRSRPCTASGRAPVLTSCARPANYLKGLDFRLTIEDEGHGNRR